MRIGNVNVDVDLKLSKHLMSFIFHLIRVDAILEEIEERRGRRRSKLISKERSKVQAAIRVGSTSETGSLRILHNL